MHRLGNTFNCPVCGEEVPHHAKSCPECGACEKSGWSGEAESSGLHLPDADFDYRKFVEDEFGDRPKKSPLHWLWALAAILIFIAMLLAFLPR